MSIRKVSFSSGEFYHIYNRGNDKRKIFHDKQDYDYFTKLLYNCNSKNNFKLHYLQRSKSFNAFDLEIDDPIVSIGAYVLMPNHFHILIIEKIDGGISKFMQKLSTGYAMYYNKKYKRTGGLFESKFKSQHLDTDRYLKYIFSYIHLNIVKLIDSLWKEKGIQDINKAMKFLNEYQYSSYLDYAQNFSRNVSKIINKKDFPDYFPTAKTFEKEILIWLNYNKE